MLIRTDGAGGTHEFLDWLTRAAVSYSVGFTTADSTADPLALIPTAAWTPAYDARRADRDGAWVAEVTAMLDLTAGPTGCGSSCARNARTPAPNCG